MSRLRILIVEDEILIALELESLLQDLGHEPVGIAATSSEALALSGEARPDLALVDIHLADGPTGVEVGRALAQAGTPVMFMTANAKRVPSDFAGGCGVIAKPYTERGVRRAVECVVAWLSGRAVGAAPEGVTFAPGWTKGDPDEDEARPARGSCALLAGAPS
ncbi:MAG TPA: response regulator [Beijerinckiaceae bacterium]|nr:response regulator [Beijerinckiaceae bacterium]